MKINMQALAKQQLLIFYTLLATLTIVVYACRKTDVRRNSDSDIPAQIAANFFRLQPNTPSFVKKIAEAIRHQNEEREFITKFSKEIGTPNWERSVAQFPSTSRYTGRTEEGGGGEEEDTLVFIPIDDGTNQSIAFMGCLVGNDSVTIRLFRGDKYLAYAGERNDLEELSPELVALQNMVLDYLTIPGSDTFRINDLDLFKYPLWRSSNASRFIALDSTGGHGKSSSLSVASGGYIPCVSVQVDEYHDIMGFYPPPTDPDYGFQTTYCVSPSSWVSYIHGLFPVVLPVGGGGGGGSWYDDPCSQMPGGTCGTQGGGWTTVSYEDNPYNPYMADTIGYTNSLKNTYPCIYNFIKDSLIQSLRPNVLAQLAGASVFEDSIYAHLTFDTSTVATQMTDPSGLTTTNHVFVDGDGFTHFRATISLNGWFLRNATREYNISTIVHEIMHACFTLRWGQYQQWLQWGPPNPIDSNWIKSHYPIYWQNYVVNGVPSGQVYDHEIMAGDYANLFRNIVSQFWNPASPQLLKDSVLKSICYGGLTKTTAWSLLPSQGNDTCDMKAIQVCAERAYTGVNYQVGLGCRTYGLKYGDSLKLRPVCQ